MKLTIVLITAIFFFGCDFPYKAGNLRELGYPIETPISTKIVKLFLDSILLEGHSVPAKWIGYDKLVNLDSINNKRIYFKENPEEMYLISYQGMVILSDVFNPDIKKFDWIAKDSLISEMKNYGY